MYITPTEVQEATRQFFEGDFDTEELPELIREGGTAAARAYVIGQVEVLRRLRGVSEELRIKRERHSQGGRKPTKATDLDEVVVQWERISAKHPDCDQPALIRELATVLNVEQARTVKKRLEAAGVRLNGRKPRRPS